MESRGKDKRERRMKDGRQKTRRGEERKGKEWGRATGGEEGITQSFLRKERGMNIPILPCSLETAASSFGGQHCLCLFPA